MPNAFVVIGNLYDYLPRQVVLPFAVIVLGQEMSQQTSIFSSRSALQVGWEREWHDGICTIDYCHRSQVSHRFVAN